jgi:hypothetical protein
MSLKRIRRISDELSTILEDMVAKYREMLENCPEQYNNEELGEMINKLSKISSLLVSLSRLSSNDEENLDMESLEAEDMEIIERFIENYGKNFKG